MTTIQPRTRPGAQARPGDVTGRKREELAREHSEEVKAREKELGLVNAAHRRSVDEDVIDPFSKEIISDADGSVRPMEEPEEDAPKFIGSNTADFAVEELPEPKTDTDPKIMRSDDQAYLNEKVVVRVNSDLEDVTLGAGNHFSFIAGRRYRVPRWVANHLEEKGLTW